MSDESDDDDKTEDPSERKKRQTEEEGRFPVSKELSNFLLMTSFTIFFISYFSKFVKDTALVAQHFLTETVLNLAVAPFGVLKLMLKHLLQLMLVPFLCFFVAAIIVNGIQTGFSFTMKKLEPDFSRLNPATGLKQMFSLQKLMDLFKGIVIIMIIIIVLWIVIKKQTQGIYFFSIKMITAQFEILFSSLKSMLFMIVAALGALALADTLWVRYKLQKSMRMTKQEVKDEFKETEGNPEIKAKLRRIRQERSMGKILGAVKKSDVLITNPTHFAVALLFDPQKMPAPMITAKGEDNVALRMKEVAEKFGVTVVSSPPLARGLYASAKVGELIPLQYYKAIAKIIAYVFSLKGKSLK